MKKDAPDLGLVGDLAAFRRSVGRREMLKWMAGATLVPLVGCADGGSAVDAGTDSGAVCSNIPDETEGPYPGDGSNGPNALTLSGIVRSDIRSTLGGAAGGAAGVGLSVRLELVNVGGGCAPLAGRAIYLWHCDRDGKYSMYNLPNENYLRGVQETDASGVATFKTIFPGCYAGRMPHMHFEVFPSLAAAMTSNAKVKTSQIAFPTDICTTVYATTGYDASAANFSATSFSRDSVFSDGTTAQMPFVTGSVGSGYSASLQIGITA